MMRRIEFADGEYYHIYNRGVEKRNLFSDQDEYDRFLEGMESFNATDPIGSLYEHSFVKDNTKREPLVEIVAYCLNPNHYHIILRQKEENGISQFMKRLGGGYSWYFNNKHHRSGTLFEGPFKAKHISTNEYLLRLSVYVNFNDIVHQLGDQVAKYGHVSSRLQFVGGEDPLLLSEEKNSHKSFQRSILSCATKVILGQFRSQREYLKFSKETLRLIKTSKDMQRDLREISFD